MRMSEESEGVRVGEGRRIQSCLKELLSSMTNHMKKEMLSIVQLTCMYCWILEVAIILSMGEVLGSLIFCLIIINKA